jgi:hypothetical protein
MPLFPVRSSFCSLKSFLPKGRPSPHLDVPSTTWAPGNPPRFFDTSLLSEEKNKQQMLEAWSEDLPCPTNDRDWPTWLEAAIGRVMHSNTRLARKKKRAQGTCVRTYAKKIQLAEIQLQNDPSNEG